ncbi:hypothetical protein CBOM_02118 [Ceraceosorus bombacis]|uniref:Uncharacterized protein n=1 Tax=Ceraceosorus bombacis TaxID=401625 RepID=A0A0P1BEB0_9BASI|nr:hypothetical protein CBOM_02118 [Ceraceosorus bombacis]
MDRSVKTGDRVLFRIGPNQVEGIVRRILADNKGEIILELEHINVDGSTTMMWRHLNKIIFV